MLFEDELGKPKKKDIFFSGPATKSGKGLSTMKTFFKLENNP